MAANVFLKALGLKTQANKLDLEPGSLVEATNVVIRRDNVIESRRGFKLYGSTFGSSSDTLKQLMEYRGVLLRHYSNQLQFDTLIPDNSTGLSIFNTFAGTFSEVEPGLRIKSIESNGNFYFTTSDGIKKISATDPLEFSTSPNYITNAGGVKALDFESKLKITSGDQSSFFTQDSVVAYRVLWLITDVNNNLIRGTPSEREEIFNPMLNLMLGDFSLLLDRLDKLDQAGGGLIDDGDYISSLNLPNTASAFQLLTQLNSLAVKLDNDIFLADTAAVTPLQMAAGAATTPNGAGTTTVRITFTSGDARDFISVGDRVFLAGFTMTAPAEINGEQIVTVVDPAAGAFIEFTNALATTGPSTVAGTIHSYNYTYIKDQFNTAHPQTPTPFPVDTIATHDELVAIQDYLESIIVRLQSELTGVISSSLLAAYITPILLTKAATVILNITVPPDVTTNHFYQIYRTAVKTAIGTDKIADLSAGDEMQLVFEDYPTDAQIESRNITIEDQTLDSFRGAFLYTNEISGEGVLQANDLPPLAKDINKFKTHVFYANTQTRHRLNLALLGVEDLISEYVAGRTPKLVISTEDGYESSTYEFRTGEEEVTTLSGLPAETGTNYDGVYFTLNAANDFGQYYVWYEADGVGVDPMVTGRIGIKVVIPALASGSDIAIETRNTLNSFIRDFSVTASSNSITITNMDAGECTDATIGTMPAPSAIVVTTQGSGEKATQEISSLTCDAGSTVGLAGKYFTLNSAFDRYRFYFWYTVDGGGTDPLVSGRTGVPVPVLSTDSSTDVATKTAAILGTVDERFSVEQLTNVLTITNVKYGYAADSTFPTPPGSFSMVKVQDGELIVLLSENASPGIAVDETARSLVRIVNKNVSDIASTFYLSGTGDTPGKILFEAKNLATSTFYFLISKYSATPADSEPGDSFSPSLTPTNLMTSFSAANPTVITVPAGHGLTNGNQIIISNTSNQTAGVPNFDGVYTVSNVTATTFTIPVDVIVGSAGGANDPKGAFTRLNDTLNIVPSDNEVSPNRLYYSKSQEPEAVPLLNYVDIGPREKQILRIIPIRDSLMIFKEEGLYRLSGEAPPWSVSLFDTTCQLQAPDSIGIVDNLIFGWTDSGIDYITESDVFNVGRPIDIDLLAINTPNYANFSTATWGIGYDADNTYTVFTVSQTTDELATIAYVYNVLTQTWTTYDKTDTCGIILSTDGKMYLGAGDTNSIEQERKDFARTDFADWEITRNLLTGNYTGDGTQIVLTDIDDIKEGDVLVQEQLLSVYDYNALLQKLDIDPGVNDTTYLSLLQAVGGNDLRNKLEDLANKLDADSGVSDTDYLNTIVFKSGSITSNSVANPTVINSPSHELVSGRIIQINSSDSIPSINGTYVVSVIDSNNFSIPVAVTTAGSTGSWATLDSDFRDIRACFNAIVDKLNTDTGVSFSNYDAITNNTIQESIITGIDVRTKTITLNLSLPYIVGPMTIYESIISTFTYAPLTAGDPVGLKQINTAHLFFQDQTFTQATLSFATDLLPMFNDILFNGQGNGIFGHANFGTGQFFGGQGNSQPFRTYIPRNAQRCTFMVVKFTHRIAREKYSVQGLSLFGNFGQSERSYR